MPIGRGKPLFLGFPWTRRSDIATACYNAQTLGHLLAEKPSGKRLDITTVRSNRFLFLFRKGFQIVEQTGELAERHATG